MNACPPSVVALLGWMSVAWLGSGFPAAGAASEPDAAGLERYHVVWDSPSRDHHGSMPLGNGEVAINAWVSPDGDLHAYLARTDAWDDNARLVKVGKVRWRFEPGLIRPDWGFRQELRLREGLIEITAGPGISGASGAQPEPSMRLRLWVDALRPVIHLEAEGLEPFAVTGHVELWRTQRQELAELQISDVLMNPARPDKKEGPTWIEPDTVWSGRTDGVGWYHHNAKSVGPSILARIQGLTGYSQPDPLLHRTFGAVLRAERGERLDDRRVRSPAARSHRWNVPVLTVHPSTPSEWKAAMESLIARTDAVDPATRRAAHTAWWEGFWDRSWIRATRRDGEVRARSEGAVPPRPGQAGGDADDADTVSRMYHLQRFITACAGRGAYPIKFNGSLFTVPPGPTEQDPDYRRWGPGYWWQNTRLPYISLCTSGDFDLQEPLFRMYVDELLPFCRYRTHRYFGHGGAFYPECIYFWGPVFSETYGWTPFEARTDKLQESGWHKWEWVGGLELCWMLLDLADHTGDRDLLERRALPLAREVLGFFEHHYPTNTAGKLVLHPSQALETWWHCTNAAPEIAGCLALTERLLDGHREIPESDRAFLRRLQAKLPPLPLREHQGKTLLAPAEFFADKRNIENPELYAVFPFRLFTFHRPNLEWAVEALRQRTDRGNFGWRQEDVFMAYLGLTDQAREYVVGRARVHDPGERFPAFWGPNYDWTPDQDHGGILMKALQAMLIQTDGPEIHLFPAWPADWDVEFKVHAPQRTVVRGILRAGRLDSLQVTPSSRRAAVRVHGVAMP